VAIPVVAEPLGQGAIGDGGHVPTVAKKRRRSLARAVPFIVGATVAQHDHRSAFRKIGQGLDLLVGQEGRLEDEEQVDVLQALGSDPGIRDHLVLQAQVGQLA